MDPALKLHEMFRPPWKRDYTVEENYQVASVNGLPVLYLVVCNDCKTVHIQDKMNCNNLLRHLDKHNIETDRPGKCKSYPTGKRWSQYQAASIVQRDATSYQKGCINREFAEQYDNGITINDEPHPLSIVEDK